MRFILTPVGSSGDVHPFLGLGRLLRDRGHEVVLITAAPFREAADRNGLLFASVWGAEEFEEGTKNPDLWHPTRGPRLMFRTVADRMRRQFALVGEHAVPGQTVLVGHTLAFGTRMFEDVHGTPAATLHLSPGLFRSLYEQPAMKPGRDLTRAPRWLKRAYWWAVDRFMIDPAIVPALNQWRRELGLPPVARVFKDWLHSPQRVIGLFPDWFGRPQPDWPPQVRLVGFPLFDEAAHFELGPELESFLAGGGPPIVFTPGTANRQTGAFFAAAVEACLRLGRRGLLLTPYADSLPATLPDTVRHVAYAPFSLLLPRVAALVHHGGIGTSAQALRAGVPQLVTPHAFDQPDNASRLARLGVARFLLPGRITGEQVAAELEALLGSAAVVASCSRYRDAMAGGGSLARACDLLEALPGTGFKK
jgi:rhamnosyltransferase subunit B